MDSPDTLRFHCGRRRELGWRRYVGTAAVRGARSSRRSATWGVPARCAELAAERADAADAAALRGLLVGPDADVGVWRHADAELWLSVAALTQSARVTREVVRLEADF